MLIYQHSTWQFWTHFCRTKRNGHCPSRLINTHQARHWWLPRGISIQIHSLLDFCTLQIIRMGWNILWRNNHILILKQLYTPIWINFDAQQIFLLHFDCCEKCFDLRQFWKYLMELFLRLLKADGSQNGVFVVSSIFIIEDYQF